MRALITFLLSLFITLNAANAAVHGVDDAFRMGALHGAVVGQGADFLQHDHDHETDPGSSGASGFEGGDSPSHGNALHHHHCHVHPSFSTLISALPTVPALSGADVLSAPAAAALVSAILPRLERPPRDRLA